MLTFSITLTPYANSQQKLMFGTYKSNIGKEYTPIYVTLL